MVQAWTDAQSSNDFESYERLYADRFTGVKRAGTFTARLDRKAWMADRKTMIAPGLVVEARDPAVDVTDAIATVRFTQHYKSAHFEDVGPKQLVVIATLAGPRIAREEMLSSSIQMQGMGKPLSARLHAADSRGVFLVVEATDDAGKGSPRVVTPEYLDGVQEADRDVDPKALTDQQRAYEGRSFTVYDAAGNACPVVVKGFTMKSLLVAHFGVLQSFEDKTQYPDPVALAKKKAETYVELSGPNGRYLYGRFETPCKGARWAVEGSAIAVTPAVEATPAERDAALFALRATKPSAALQAEFVKDHPEKKSSPWYAYDGNVTVAAFRPPQGASTLIVGAHGGAGCNDFYGSLMAVFDAADAAHPSLRGTVNDSPSFPRLLAAVDLDGDGDVEFIAGPTDETSAFDLIRRRSKSGPYVRERFFEVPFLDCPC